MDGVRFDVNLVRKKSECQTPQRTVTKLEEIKLGNGNHVAV